MVRGGLLSLLPTWFSRVLIDSVLSLLVLSLFLLSLCPCLSVMYFAYDFVISK